MNQMPITTSGALRYGTMPDDGTVMGLWRSRFSHYVRRRLLHRFLASMRPTSRTTILDVGVTSDTTAPESNFLERLYPWPSRITACGIETAPHWKDTFPHTPFLRADGLSLPFADDSFDMVFCSAVIEHVGSRERQARLVSECLRVAPRLFITTPNRGCLIELHTGLPFLHWMPLSWYRRILRNIPAHSYLADESVLHPLFAHELLGLVPEGFDKKLDIHALLGLPTNLVLSVSRTLPTSGGVR